MRTTAVSSTLAAARALAVVAALAAGIAGFGTGGTAAAPIDVAEVAAEGGLPQQACDHAEHEAAGPSRIAVSCRTIVVVGGLPSGR